MLATTNADFLMLHVANVGLGLLMVVPILAMVGGVVMELLHRPKG